MRADRHGCVYGYYGVTKATSRTVRRRLEGATQKDVHLCKHRECGSRAEVVYHVRAVAATPDGNLVNLCLLYTSDAADE